MYNGNPRARLLDGRKAPDLAILAERLDEYRGRFPEADVHFEGDGKRIIAIAPFRFRTWEAYEAFRKAGSPGPANYMPQ